MKIENNILKYYLRDVYFITGTAYAGKSTMVKMLAEKKKKLFLWILPIKETFYTHRLW